MLNLIYPILDSKGTAIEQLDGVICDGSRLHLNYIRKIVPVNEDELEDSRETDTLAVHGVPYNWAKSDLLKEFHRADISNSLTQQGTIFLKYRQSQYAIQVSCRNKKKFFCCHTAFAGFHKK